MKSRKEKTIKKNSISKQKSIHNPLKAEKTVTKKSRRYYLILVPLLIAASLSYYFIFSNRCNLPVEFSIGSIDGRFGVTEEDALSYAKDSAEKWNKAMGKTVLVYNENAELKINFVYDYRQENLDELKSEMSNLDISDASIKEAKVAISNKITQYESDLKDYNSRVAYWNSVGGAPTITYNELQNEREELEQRRKDLTKAITLLDSEIDSYNKGLSQLKQEIEEKKETTEVQGVYKGSDKVIDIYTFGEIDELKVVLMHEFGHAIGADHADNPKSIMYYLIEDQDYSNASLTSEDIQLVKDACGI